jgi:hypothetical protein
MAAAKKKTSSAAKKVNRGRVKASKSQIMYFMGQLIQAGHLEEIPEDANGRNLESRRLRQMAEALSRQVRNFEGEDFGGDEE